MLWIGLKKDSSGYYQAMKAFERNGPPLPPKIRKALAAEIGRARAELDRLERAIVGSAKKKPRKAGSDGG